MSMRRRGKRENSLLREEEAGTPRHKPPRIIEDVGAPDGALPRCVVCKAAWPILDRAAITETVLQFFNGLPLFFF